MVGLAGKRGDISDEPARGNAFNRRNGREPATKYDLALSFLSDTTRIPCLTAADAAAAAAAATGAASAVTAVVAAAATVAAAAAAAVGGFAIGNWRRQSEKTPLELMRRNFKSRKKIGAIDNVK
ncbi:hypothetical protein HZH66_005691 [Vespula vulgaris]|uniref:Uncharacterized protein n=1 Tax=Vespula vulgaris TaxID=7454 RepID=A0A834K5G3_VESVU|nr:hypothetical protein HZH66_005691 [Vespula vulgaris]